MKDINPGPSIVLDVHAHLVPVLPARLSEFTGVQWDPARRSMSAEGRALGPQLVFQPEALIAWMDRNRVGQAWISIPPPAYRPELDERSTRDWVRYVNDGLANIAEKSGARLSPLFHLPVEHPSTAVDIASAFGRKFSMSAGGTPTICLSDASYEPLWSALNAQDAFLFIHPGTTCDPRLDKYFLRNLLGNPFETAVAASHLVLSGVLERHPQLEVCLAHGGGVIPAVAGRIDHGHAKGALKEAASVESPARSFQRFCVDCISHGPSALKLAADIFGEDHIYFGSDWPFPMGLIDPHDELASLEGGLRGRVFETNPSKLLKRFESE